MQYQQAEQMAVSNTSCERASAALFGLAPSIESWHHLKLLKVSPTSIKIPPHNRSQVRAVSFGAPSTQDAFQDSIMLVAEATADVIQQPCHTGPSYQNSDLFICCRCAHISARVNHVYPAQPVNSCNNTSQERQSHVARRAQTRPA